MKLDLSTGQNRALFERFHIDLPLLLGILVLMGFALLIMYSASGQSLAMMDRQAMRMALSLGVMIFLAQISPRTYETLAPVLFIGGVILLLGVLFFGEASKGAQRWLNFGFVRFQPSELLKLAVPLMLARYIGKRSLPPTFQTLVISLVMVFGTHHSYCQAARFRNVNLDCGVRYFRDFLGGYQLENHRECSSGSGCVYPNFVVFLNA